MVLDLLGDSGSVTGVDVARHRLAACRTMVQKYALGDRCRLLVADGTSFSLIPSIVLAATKLRKCRNLVLGLIRFTSVRCLWKVVFEIVPFCNQLMDLHWRRK